MGRRSWRAAGPCRVARRIDRGPARARRAGGGKRLGRRRHAAGPVIDMAAGLRLHEVVAHGPGGVAVLGHLLDRRACRLADLVHHALGAAGCDIGRRERLAAGHVGDRDLPGEVFGRGLGGGTADQCRGGTSACREGGDAAPSHGGHVETLFLRLGNWVLGRREANTHPLGADNPPKACEQRRRRGTSEPTTRPGRGMTDRELLRRSAPCWRDRRSSTRAIARCGPISNMSSRRPSISNRCSTMVVWCRAFIGFTSAALEEL